MSFLNRLLGRTSVDPAWGIDVIETNKFSPDIPALEQFDDHLLFVCNEWQKRHPKHELIQPNAAFLAIALTVSDKFTMWKKKLGKESFAIPLEEKSRRDGLAKRAKIRGEVYLVPTSTILRLDRETKNGVQFQRKKIEVAMAYRELMKDERDSWFVERIATANCWFYQGVKPYWDDHITADLYSKVKLFQPRRFSDAINSPNLHYAFRPEEYNV